MPFLDDGYQTLLTFALASSVEFRQKEVTPPGIQGGGAIDTTTMENTNWRSFAPKSLKTLSNASFSAAYDPEVYDSILAMLQINQLITVTFPDDSTVAFWGWIDEFTPARVTEGSQPVAEVVIVPSNMNNSQVEVAPDYNA